MEPEMHEQDPMALLIACAVKLDKLAAQCGELCERLAAIEGKIAAYEPLIDMVRDRADRGGKLRGLIARPAPGAAPVMGGGHRGIR